MKKRWCVREQALEECDVIPWLKEERAGSNESTQTLMAVALRNKNTSTELDFNGRRLTRNCENGGVL